MPNILDEIVAAKTQELAEQKLAVSINDLLKAIAAQPPALSLAAALGAGGVQLIAEVKKASPSRGLLRPNFDPVELAGIYSSNGAAAISVLTDPRFQGELEHVVRIKRAGASRTAPVLRKDFIFDPYQVFEAKAAGADAVLLIVAILSPPQIKEYMGIASELGMDCLVEVHDEEELQVATDAGATIIGINNRDLRTFNTDLAVTERLSPLAYGDKVIVSESGIHQPGHLTRLAECGVNAALVGEALVTSDDVARKVREMAGQAVSPAKP